jgi:Glyoxalase-like domain
MSLELDHIFICCAPGAPEADALLRLRLLEGSPNNHPGQGTENRRFFFKNAFLELLWVSNPKETQNPRTRRTRLWERWSQRATGTCPFGIAFRPAGPTVDEPPFPTWRYTPAYLPEGLSIHFAEGTSLKEPEFFYFSWPSRSSTISSQPTGHDVPLHGITSVVVGIPDLHTLSDTALKVASAGLVSFKKAPAHILQLGITAETEVVYDLRPELPVVLQCSAVNLA